MKALSGRAPAHRVEMRARQLDRGEGAAGRGRRARVGERQAASRSSRHSTTFGTA